MSSVTSSITTPATRTRRRSDAVGFTNDDATRRSERRPLPSETRVAANAGLDPSRNLARACADFYLLSYLRRPHYVPEAARRLELLVEDLASEFTVYLDLACGGELRHASSWPYELPPCPVIGASSDRSVAWREWLAWESPLYRAEYAVQAFEQATWPGRNYGGEPWAEIAAVLESHLRGALSAELFLDRVWNLQHHGGIVLNKVYETEELATVLQAHGKDDNDALLSYASEPTKDLWAATFSRGSRSLAEIAEMFLLWERLSFGSTG